MFFRSERIYMSSKPSSLLRPECILIVLIASLVLLLLAPIAGDIGAKLPQFANSSLPDNLRSSAQAGPITPR